MRRPPPLTPSPQAGRGNALLVLVALAGLLAGCVAIQSDPLPGGGYVSYPVIVTREARPLGEWPTPTVEAVQWTPIPTAVVDPCVVTTALVNLNVRAGPGIEYAVVGTMPQGVPVIVVDVAGDWYQVVTPSGYVAGWLVTVSGECDDLGG